MSLLTNFSLKNLNSWGVGGSCTKLVSPKTVDDVVNAYLLAKRSGEHIYILGGGSNVLIAEGKVDAVVIHSLSLREIIIKRDILNNRVEIEVESGFPVRELLSIAIKNNLTGVEFLTGIPGTVGGAIWGNAGAGGENLRNCVTRIETIENNGNIRVWNKDELDWKYRACPLNSLGTVMITKCFLSLDVSNKDKIVEKVKNFAVLKKGQPLGKMTAGCVFKNPEGMYAGRLLEDAKCKELYFGDAVVSPTHANFIENTGTATASDIFNLCEKCRERVYNQCGVELEYEIRFFGDFQKKE